MFSCSAGTVHDSVTQGGQLSCSIVLDRRLHDSSVIVNCIYCMSKSPLSRAFAHTINMPAVVQCICITKSLTQLCLSTHFCLLTCMSFSKDPHTMTMYSQLAHLVISAMCNLGTQCHLVMPDHRSPPGHTQQVCASSNVCKHLERYISELTYKHVVLLKTAGVRICQEHTCPGHAQTQPCTELRISIPCSYAEVQICVGSTKGNSALICELAERYISVCLLLRTGLCVL